MSGAARKPKSRLISIDAHPQEVAVVVRYEVPIEITPGTFDVEPKEKVIPLHKVLHPESNLADLAQKLCDKYKVLPLSKKGLVEEVLGALVDRMWDAERDNEVEFARTEMREQMQMWEGAQEQQPEEVASLDMVDDYLEKLYESDEEKVTGTFMLLQLARNPSTLIVLGQNEALMGALARTLSEDGRKNMDLATNIVYIFFFFSSYTQMHPLLIKNHVGVLTMKSVEYEIKRYRVRSKEVKRIEAERGPDVEAELRKFRALVGKQNRLLYLCFYLLLNLAEDIGIEKKMKNKGVINLLVHCLGRSDENLLVLVLTFLKKLSIVKENVDDMAKMQIVEKLVPLIDMQNDALVNVALRMLVNLSFDPTLRDVMVKNSLIPKLVELLKTPTHRDVVLKLLYHISQDDRCKSMFTYTDAIPLLLELVIQAPGDLLPRELAALVVNLTANARNAEIMCQRGLPELMARVFKTRDPLLMKIVRNLSQHDYEARNMFGDYIEELVALLVTLETPDLLVEVLGALGNLPLSDFQFHKLQSRYHVIEFLQKHLLGNYIDDDVVLDMVIFVGAFAASKQCAPYIARSRIVHLMYDVLSSRGHEDEEIALQTLFAFSKFLQHKETRDVFLNATQAVLLVIPLLYSANPEVRKQADFVLDMVMDYDADWADQIRTRKFRAYNAQWLRAVLGDDGEYDEFDEGNVHFVDAQEGSYGDEGDAAAAEYWHQS